MFCSKYENTNIIILTVPHRYDLPAFSCVNSEIEKVNKKLGKWGRKFRHVKILNASMDRSGYTNHGMHLNRKGKMLIAKSIANVIINNPNNIVEPIAVQWYSTTGTDHLTYFPSNKKFESTFNCEIEGVMI